MFSRGRLALAIVAVASLVVASAASAVPPTVTITAKPPNPSNVTAPTFAFTASEPSAECKLDAAAFEAPCPSPKGYTGLSDGSHTFTVQATNVDGTGSESYTWTIDTVAPAAPTVGAKPSNPSNNRSASFSFTATDGSPFCRLDAAVSAPCTSPIGYSNLGTGPHTFGVKATDSAGNTGPETTYTWIIDTVAPAAPIITAPPTNPSNNPSPSFSFTASEAGSTFACRLDGAAFASCPSPKSYIGLGNGSHMFRVRATDPAGNTGPVAAYTWTIDTVAPATPVITGKPGNPSNNRSPSFTFTASDGTTFCRLDAGASVPCASPFGYSDLGDGPHTFGVKATDPAGNTGPETTHTWTIESRAPSAALISIPSGLSNTSAATFAFSADEPSSFDCSLDSRGFDPCTSPASYHGLGDGPHAFRVRARDAVGNFSAPVGHAWTIDTAAPETTLASAPKSGPATSATFAFSASESGTFECRLDSAPFTLCASPKNYSRLSRGAHLFEVRAIDAAGNADASPSLHEWRIAAAAATKASALLSPKAEARVSRPPLLVWRRAARAGYYNVQVFRGARKVLSAWPRRTRLQLHTRWRYLGRKQRLAPGSYRWYVWPGYGAPSARRYGSMLGQSTFVVRR